MAKIYADRIRETSTSIGTTDFALAGASLGYLPFSKRLADADTCSYVIVSVDSTGVPTGDWEVGTGKYNKTANTLTRTTVSASSNADGLTNFGIGTKVVFLDLQAADVNTILNNASTSATNAASSASSASSSASAAATSASNASTSAANAATSAQQAAASAGTTNAFVYFETISTYGSTTADSAQPIYSSAAPPSPATNTGATSRPAGGLTKYASAVMHHINLAEYWDCSTWTNDSATIVQAVLDYASHLAIVLKRTTYDGIFPRAWVEVFVPRGLWPLGAQIVVPEWVKLGGPGLFIRGNYGALNANLWLHAIATVMNGHLGLINLMCNPAGNASMGSGILNCRNWLVSNGGTSAAPISTGIGAAGSGYSAGDVITLNNPSPYPYIQAQVTVSTVNGSGGVTAYYVSNKGAYSKRPALYGSTETIGQAYAKTSGGANSPGTGFAIIPTWNGDMLLSTETGYPGVNHGKVSIGNGWYEHLYVYGAGIQYNTTSGAMNAVQVSTQNLDIPFVYVQGGKNGIYFQDGSDCRVWTMNGYLNGISWVVNGYSALTCPHVVIDSCFDGNVSIAGCSGIRLTGRLFFENGNDGNVTALGASVTTTGFSFTAGGPYDGGRTPSGIVTDCRIDFSNTSAGFSGNRPMAYIDRAYSSHFNLEGSNIYYTGGVSPKPIGYYVKCGPNTFTHSKISGMVQGLSGGIFDPAGSEWIGDVDVHDSDVPDGAGGTYTGRATPRGTYIIWGNGAPVNGTTGTGVNKAGTGSQYYSKTAVAGRVFWTNTGTAASPSWN